MNERNAQPDRDDPAERWRDLRARYPEAGKWADEGWQFGALRHHDGVIRERDLGHLIDALEAREQEPRM